MLEKQIVELRAAGFSWWQIDQTLFPGQVTKEQCYGGKSPSYKLAQKKKLNAFSKKVHGLYTPTQVVEKLNNFGKLPVEIAKELDAVLAAA